MIAYRLPTVARGVACRRHPEPLHVAASPARCLAAVARCSFFQCLDFQGTRKAESGRLAVRSLATRGETQGQRHSMRTNRHVGARPLACALHIRSTDANSRDATVRVAGDTSRPDRRYLHAKQRNGVGVRAVTGVGASE